MFLLVTFQLHLLFDGYPSMGGFILNVVNFVLTFVSVQSFAFVQVIKLNKDLLCFDLIRFHLI